MVQQIDLTSCTVEVRGESGEKMQTLLSTSKAAPTVALTEYLVTPDPEARKSIPKKKGKKGRRRSSQLYPVLLLVLKVRKVKRQAKKT